MFHEKFGRKESSVIASDYCYNRVNNGITLNKPAVFEFLGRDQYRCLGLNYPFNGSIYHKPKGQGEFIVGKCVNGERIIESDKDFKAKDNEINIDEETKNTPKYNHKTSRDPSMKLRFEILKRDNFKCCACGASLQKIQQ